MAGSKIETNKDKLMNIAAAIVAIGGVKKNGNFYEVRTKVTTQKGQEDRLNKVQKEGDKIVCGCLPFNEQVEKDPHYQCEHILAVKTFVHQGVELAGKVAEKRMNAVESVPAKDLKKHLQDKDADKAAGEKQSALVEVTEESLLEPEYIKIGVGNPFQIYKGQFETPVYHAGDLYSLPFTDSTEISGRAILLKADVLGLTEETAPLFLDGLRRYLNGVFNPVKKQVNEAVDKLKENSKNDPVAKNIGDLISAKQIGLIRAIAREKGIDADRECNAKFGCNHDELGKKPASEFIKYLQDFKPGEVQKRSA